MYFILLRVYSNDECNAIGDTISLQVHIYVSGAMLC